MLQADKGEIILLTGDIGSGKTLWLKRLAGLVKLPATISALINGKTPGREIGDVRMLFDQQPPLWLGQNVAEELVFGLKSPPSGEVLSKALHDWKADELQLSQSTTSLNRIQAIRLTLTSISLANPKLALLDCPTDSLPQKDAIAIQKLVSSWARESNATVVVASNRWHDWREVATQTWRVEAADDLPQWGEQS